MSELHQRALTFRLVSPETPNKKKFHHRYLTKYIITNLVFLDHNTPRAWKGKIDLLRRSPCISPAACTVDDANPNGCDRNIKSFVLSVPQNVYRCFPLPKLYHIPALLFCKLNTCFLFLFPISLQLTFTLYNLRYHYSFLNKTYTSIIQ